MVLKEFGLLGAWKAQTGNWVSSSFISLFIYQFEDCWYAQKHTKKQIVFLTIPSCYHCFSQQGCDWLWQRNHYGKSSPFSEWGFHGHPGWGGREEGMLICTTHSITIMYYGVSWYNNYLWVEDGLARIMW